MTIGHTKKKKKKTFKLKIFLVKFLQDDFKLL